MKIFQASADSDRRPGRAWTIIRSAVCAGALLCWAPSAAWASGSNDGLYWVGYNGDVISVQTLSSGMVIVARTNYSGGTIPLVAHLYVGTNNGNSVNSSSVLGYPGTPPQLTLNFSGGTFKLTTPGSPPAVTTEPIMAIFGWSAASGPYDLPYWLSTGGSSGDLLLVQTFQSGIAVITHLTGTTSALSGTLNFVYASGIQGARYTVGFIQGANSPAPSVTIDFQNRVHSLTPNQGQTTQNPIFPLS